jgi:ABC-type transporter Mla subunit MlaD
MSNASQFEQENDNQFHLLANKVSAFKNIANDINSYAREDNHQLNTIGDQLNTLSDSIKSTTAKLNHVIRSNPKVTKMAGVGFIIFLLIYYSVKYLF